jgi:hypothetical protein
MNANKLYKQESLKYSRFYSNKTNFKTIDISKLNMTTTKSLTNNKTSFSNKQTYDTTLVNELKPIRSKLMLELHKDLPFYESFIKTKSTIYYKHKTDSSYDNKANTIQFEISKDESKLTLWITCILSYDETVLDIVEEEKLNLDNDDLLTLNEMLNELDDVNL